VAPITQQQQAMGNDSIEQTDPPAAMDDPGAGNLDKVRDILFGGQMRDLDRRFARVEERLSTETADLKEEMRRRLATIEQFARTETETLAARIKAEHDARGEATSAASRELRETSAAFDRKVGMLDDQLARAQRELRQQILEMQQRLADEMQERIDGVLARLRQEAGDLRAGKADRATLAALFTEIAMRLTQEPPARREQEPRRD
jgi:hypothetical protein